MSNVTGLDISKQLQPIMKGVETEKVWIVEYYWEAGERKEKVTLEDSDPIRIAKAKMGEWDCVLSYSLDDLLSVMPDKIEVDCEIYYWIHTRSKIMYITDVLTENRNYTKCLRVLSNGQISSARFEINDKKSLTQAAADLLIWLYEQGYVEGKV